MQQKQSATSRMGAYNEPITQPTNNQRPTSRANSSICDLPGKPSPKQIDPRLQSQHIIYTHIDGYKCQFILLREKRQITIKCSMTQNGSNTENKKKSLICTYSYQGLPHSLKITYQSIQQLFQQFKYIIQQNLITDRLRITNQGRFIFHLQTKKKGKIEFVPQQLQMQQQNQQRKLQRLQQDIQRLRRQDIKNKQIIQQLQNRMKKMQTLIGIKQEFNENGLKSFEQSGLGREFFDAEESIIKKFKKSKSNQQLKKIAQSTDIEDQFTQKIHKVLKTTIKQFDCFFQLSQNELSIQLLSRNQAKIYKCRASQDTIPKQVYSFIPTPKKLYEEIDYIIEHSIMNRLDVIDANFIYKASINEKNQQVLIAGIFPTILQQQNDIDRIEQLVSIKTSNLQQDMTYLKLQFGLLKKNLQANGLVLEIPKQFCAIRSTIIETDSQYITLCKFFGDKKIHKIQLLYRASQNNFQIKKFHEKCDGVPNTLTLTLTQFDKKIGGFTPLPWDKNGNDKFLTDYHNLSFLFSLTNGHKLALQQSEFAIKQSNEDGPRFGNGCDLVIKDQANLNNNSYANICTSYRHPRYNYKSQESYEKFSGDTKNNRFRIVQWEVYQVFFEE